MTSQEIITKALIDYYSQFIGKEVRVFHCTFEQNPNNSYWKTDSFVVTNVIVINYGEYPKAKFEYFYKGQRLFERVDYKDLIELV